MSQSSPAIPRVNLLLSTFQNSGLLYGALLGILIGVLVAGPHFVDWSIGKILSAIAICVVTLGITGYIASFMFPCELLNVPDDYASDEVCWGDDAD